MPTRGLYGVHIDGETKVTLSPYDSYPVRLGLRMIEAFETLTPEAARELRVINRVIANNAVPAAEANRVRQALGRNDLPASNWYDLLRPTFGEPDATFKAGVLIDAFEFGDDSLHCEWAYIFNFDTETLEVYRGAVSEQHEEGFWSDVQMQRGGFYGIRKTYGYFFDALPSAKRMANLERFDANVEML
jgi:hypothetical protein